MPQVDLRDSRLAAIPSIGPAGIARMRSGKVLLVGAGNIGCQVAQHLSLLRVPLLVLDKGRVKLENLGTQNYAGQAGAFKAEALVCQLTACDPDLPATAIVSDLADLGAGVLANCALVISALDSWTARLRLLELMQFSAAPLIDCAVDGSGRHHLARVAVYPPLSPTSPCLGCAMDLSFLHRVRRDAAPAGCPSWRQALQHPIPAPTLAVSATGALSAALAVQAAIAILTADPGQWLGTEVLLDAGAITMRTHLLPRNPRCLFPHEPLLSPAEAGRRGLLTVNGTFAFAEQAFGGAAASLSLCAGRSVVVELICDACRAIARPNRLLRALQPGSFVCACGGNLNPSALGLLDRFDRETAAPFLRSTWASLGLPPNDIVVASSGARSIALRIPLPSEDLS